MNQTTARKIRRMADRLHKIHESRRDYDFVIPLLDEPYQLALKILDYGLDSDPYEVAKNLNVNWQTVKQIQKALL
jgi:hypothetical protein